MAQTLYVDPNRAGAYPTLKDAVGEAPAGSVIVVAAGDYADHLDLTGLDLTIEAAPSDAPEEPERERLPVVIRGGDDWAPTITCRSGRLTLTGVAVYSAESDAVRVSDTELTMTGCHLAAPVGTGLRLGDRSTATVSACRVADCQQGVLAEDADGLIDDCTIRSSADDGVIARLGASLTLRNTHIEQSGNRGVYLYQSAKPTLQGCEISQSRAEGILVSQGAAPTLQLCKVSGTQGAGIKFEPGTSGKVVNCLVENAGGDDIEISPDAEVTVSNEKATSAGLGAIEAPRGNQERVEELLKDLDNMVGLEGVKEEVRSIIDEIQVNEWRRAAGLSTDGMSNHLIFAGAPGTGKTTVGRIYGELLAALGVLPGGPLKEVSRRDLVGQYIGHTAEKTAAVFDEAKGGVVFLDEAYTLTRQAGGGSNDFGQEAVDMIVKLMEDMRKEIAVIAAGYTNEMRDFLDANPGLASRFVKTIEFENYSPEDLTLITTRMMTSGDYQPGAGVEELLLEHFRRVPRDENFGNARDARKLFEKLRKVQSQRLRAAGGQPDLAALMTITADDVRVAVS